MTPSAFRRVGGRLAVIGQKSAPYWVSRDRRPEVPFWGILVGVGWGKRSSELQAEGAHVGTIGAHFLASRTPAS